MAEDINFGTVIDPNQYIIGPGDQFRIDFWDGSTNPMNLDVTPEGTVLLTSMGRVDVGGVTLTEAKKRLRSLIDHFYADRDFSISLIGIRPIKVLIAGAVKNPGLYDAFVSQRVSEIINMAGGLLPGASHRKIIFNGNGSGDGQLIDMLRFERAGDLDCNPYLYAGHKIQIPLVTDSLSFVQISGEVHQSGGVEYREGDVLGSIIALARGLTGLEGDSAYIFRHQDDHVSRLAVPLSDSGQPIMPGDKIIVSPAMEKQQADFFSITGEIRVPGRYPHYDSLSLAGAIEIAGSLTLKADYNSITVFRNKRFRYNEETARMLTASNTNNLSFDSELAPVSLRIDGSNFDKLKSVTVFPGDSIVIPTLTGSAGVFGMVRYPGMIALSGPSSASDLIKKAGGYTSKARKGTVEVIRKTSGIRLVSDPRIEIYDGDAVLIPEEKSDKSTWNKIKDVVMMLGSAGIIYLAIDNLSD